MEIEDLLLEVGRKTQMAEEEEMNTSHDLREKLADLISERKLTRSRKGKISEARASKLIKKEMKEPAQARKRAKIDKVL